MLPVFRSARIKLTLTYTLAIALVMAAFSVALYLSLSTAMSSTIDSPEKGAGSRLEQTILQAELTRARLALLGINAAGWILAATASYVVAGRTLAPIEAVLARQRQFTAHASHELRTPLTVIKGEIGVTRARERSPEQYRQTLDRIDGEVVHLETMVSDLLALARMESGQGGVDRHPGNLATIASDALTPFHSRIRDQNIEVKLLIPADLEAVLDWTRIRNLLVNLIDNAISHTPPGGRIEIHGEAHGRYMNLTVFNTGAPIQSSDLPHLFVPFFRGRGNHAEAGAGLGLALCDWIVQSHRGSIAAHNVNGGVSFDVRLPRD